MLGTEELWDEWVTELEFAKFSTIAAGLLMEEFDKIETKKDLKDYQKRFNRHIRASNQHVRNAERIRRKIQRIEKKYGRRNSAGSSRRG